MATAPHPDAAASGVTAPVLTTAQIAAARSAAQTVERFAAAAVQAFIAASATHNFIDDRGRPVGTIEGSRTHGNYGTWSFDRHRDADEAANRTGNRAPNGEGDQLVFRHRLSDDRGGGSSTFTVSVPVEVLTGASRKAERRRLYEQLRAEFDPDFDPGFGPGIGHS